MDKPTITIKSQSPAVLTIEGHVIPPLAEGERLLIVKNGKGLMIVATPPNKQERAE